MNQHVIHLYNLLRFIKIYLLFIKIYSLNINITLIDTKIMKSVHNIFI